MITACFTSRSHSNSLDSFIPGWRVVLNLPNNLPYKLHKHLGTMHSSPVSCLPVFAPNSGLPPVPPPTSSSNQQQATKHISSVTHTPAAKRKTCAPLQKKRLNSSVGSPGKTPVSHVSQTSPKIQPAIKSVRPSSCPKTSASRRLCCTRGSRWQVSQWHKAKLPSRPHVHTRSTNS